MTTTNPDNVMEILKAAQESKEIAKEGKLLEATIEFNRWLSSLTMPTTPTPQPSPKQSPTSTQPQPPPPSAPGNMRPGNEAVDDSKIIEQANQAGSNSPGPTSTVEIAAAEAKAVEGTHQDFKFTQEALNKDLGGEVFNMWERAKLTINSPILIFLGLFQLLKAGKVSGLNPSQEKQVNNVANSFFLKLEENEKAQLDSLFSGANDDTLPKIWKVMVERDSKYGEGQSAISIYALLFLFNYNRLPIVQGMPLIPQLQANQCLFSGSNTEGNLATQNNQEALANICAKLISKLKEVTIVYDTYVKNANAATNAELQRMKTMYNEAIVKEKSVIAMVKRRDDWNNNKFSQPTKKHHRFILTSGDGDVKENSYLTPLTLNYNDTPLQIPKGTREYEKNFTHNYNFFGFDLQFNSTVDNKGISQNLYRKFLAEKVNKPEEKTLPSLCFIGYGQSGSGKTSALIYLDVPGIEQDGILIETLKQLKPSEIEISMIEIYRHKSALEADKTCSGIATHDNPEENGLIIDPCPAKVPAREVLNLSGILPDAQGDYTPNLRYVPIGEIIDKAYDNAGKPERKSTEEDVKTSVIFKKGGNGWFYTHHQQGEQGLDKDLDLKIAILNAFECREIGPTGNNKQSSRSHVVFSMKCKGINGNKEMTIFVCDLAGVENVFDCSPGSTDSIRFAAKTLANKNYSRDLGGGRLEEWGDHKKKRAGNLVKYLHHDMIAGKSTETDPNCWPDGSPNSKGDLDSIAENYSLDLFKRLAADAKGIEWRTAGNMNGGAGKRRKKRRGKSPSRRHAYVNAGELYDFYEEKLSVLPVVPESNEKGKMFPFLKNNIENILRLLNGNAYYGSGAGGSQPMREMFKDNKGNWRGYKKLTTAIGNNNLLEILDAIAADNWGNSRNQIGETVIPFGENIKNAFRGLKAPDCVSAFGSGLKRACEIRRDEGYIINNSLAQLTKDLKRVSAVSIKEKLSPNGEFPCIYSDVYDDHSQYAIAADPLIGWYDIQNDEEREQDYGSILTAMCILGIGRVNLTKDEKTTFLKTFRFCMTTVLNESFIMNFGGSEATTAAGNYIYVNNPPLPPYLCISKLEKAFKRYLYYKYDPRAGKEGEDPAASLKRNTTMQFLNSYYNMIIKMMTHPNYETVAIEELKKFPGNNPETKLIFFDDEKELYEAYEKLSPSNRNDIEKNVKILIALIKKGNNATYIGTIQTTCEVNRVSPSILITNEINQESKLSSITIGNVNNDILKDLYKSVFLEENAAYNLKRRGKSKNKKGKAQKRSALIYECLYHLNKHTAEKQLTKRALSMKERDIEQMMIALEAVFPLATRYVDYKRIQNVWETVSSKERNDFIVQIDPEEGNTYPFKRDLCAKSWPETLPSTGGTEPESWFQKLITAEPEVNMRSRLKVSDIVSLCTKIKELIVAEPAPVYVKEEMGIIGVMDVEVGKDKWNKRTIQKEVGLSSRTNSFRKKYGDIKKPKARFLSFMQFFVRDDFFKNVYQELIQAIDEATDKAGTYKEIKPIPFKTLHYPGNDRKQIEPKISEDLIDSANDLTREASNAWLLFSGKEAAPDENHSTGWGPVSTSGGYKKKKSRRRQTKRNKKSKKRNTRKR